MRTIFMACGLPASGKSTWAKQILTCNPGRFKRINKDDLRAMLDNGVWSPDNEKFVQKLSDEATRQALKQGYDVILDNTHMTARARDRVHKLAEGVGDITVVEKVFVETVETCINRDKNRGPAMVGEQVIRDMAKKAGVKHGYHKAQVMYYPSKVAPQAIVQDETLPEVILCDLDGTLALMGDRNPYDATDCDVKDLPNWPVIECVKAMHVAGRKIIFMSGREDKYRPETVRFIEKYCRVPSNELTLDAETFESCVIPYELHMRTTGDGRKDVIIKRELFEKHVASNYRVLFVIDDRNSVVQGWREMGLTCFQCAEGDF